MDWTLISALTSIVGVAGGLISPAFVILGLRRNARAIEGSTVQSLMVFEKDVYPLLLVHSGLYLRGCADLAGLSPEDRFRFDRLVNSQMSLFYSAFEQYRQGLMDEEVWQAYHNAMREDLRGPGFPASWTDMQNNHAVSFRRKIEGE